MGAELHTDTTISAIETSGDAVTSVRANGQTFQADGYVMALGSYSPMLARTIGVDLPIYPIKGYSLTIPVGNHQAPPTIGSVDETNLVAISRFGDRVRVTATAEFAGYDTSHRPADFAFMTSVVQDAVSRRRRLSPCRDVGGAAADDAGQSAGAGPQEAPQSVVQYRPRPYRLDHVARYRAHHRRSDRRARAGDSARLKEARMDVDPGFTDLGVLPCTLDAGIAARAAIGLLVLATDQTMEHEFRHLIRLPGVAVYQARLFNDADITTATLRAIGERIAPATELILPSLHLDVVAFGCTSASMALGEEEVFRQIRRVRPDVACTTPVTAAFAAFKALGRAADRRADPILAGSERRGAGLS